MAIATQAAFLAGEAEGVYVARLDLRALREWREQEANLWLQFKSISKSGPGSEPERSICFSRNFPAWPKPIRNTRRTFAFAISATSNQRHRAVVGS
jgi:hypothetical protein